MVEGLPLFAMQTDHRSRLNAAPAYRGIGDVQVLRIERSGNGETVFTLSGRMTDEHIVELDGLLQAEPPGRHVVLNLKDLILVGQDEIEFLARCEEQGITLRNCAPYIREWITRQRVQQ
jgi:hypothetical protein